MKTWTYKIPSENSFGGWAIIFLTETGVFSTVSDYGNYGYFWSNHGMKDVRQFFLRMLKEPGEWHYFATKLNPKKVYNGDKTYKNICDFLDSKNDLTKSEIDHEKYLLEEYECLNSEFDYQYWYLESGTKLWDCDGFAVYELDSSVTAFCQKTLPKFAQLLQKQLKEEEIE